LEHAQEKMTSRLISLFVSPAFPVVTASRFTYAMQALNRVIAGKAVRRILPRAFGKASSNEAPSTVAANVAEFGAGASDMLDQHRSRLGTVGRWLNDPASDWQVPICHVCCQINQDFEYEFFPKKGEGNLKLSKLLDRFASPVLVCLGKYHAALKDFHFRLDGPWKLLGVLGFVPSHPGMRSYARSQLLPLAVKVKFFFDIKYSNLPFSLFRVISTQWSAEEALSVLTELEQSKECCLPVFARHFKKQFGTTAEMQSPLGRMTLQAWADSRVFQTLSSEMGHDTERKALYAASAPGRAWHHHARSTILQQKRLVHMARNGRDPLQPMPPKKRRLQDARDAAQPWRNMLPDMDGLPQSGHGLTWQDVHRSSSVPVLQDQPSDAAADPCSEEGLVQQGVAPQGPAQGASVRQSGHGGSVQMTFLNGQLQARKQTLGRTLTA